MGTLPRENEIRERERDRRKIHLHSFFSLLTWSLLFDCFFASLAPPARLHSHHQACCCFCFNTKKNVKIYLPKNTSKFGIFNANSCVSCTPFGKTVRICVCVVINSRKTVNLQYFFYNRSGEKKSRTKPPFSRLLWELRESERSNEILASFSALVRPSYGRLVVGVWLNLTQRTGAPSLPPKITTKTCVPPWWTCSLFQLYTTTLSSVTSCVSFSLTHSAGSLVQKERRRGERASESDINRLTRFAIKKTTQRPARESIHHHHHHYTNWFGKRRRRRRDEEITKHNNNNRDAGGCEWESGEEE